MNQGQPHQQDRQRQHHKLRQHDPFDNFRSQHRAFVHGLSHLHQGRFGVGKVQPHPHVGDLELGALVLGVAHADFTGRDSFVFRRQRQCPLAAKKFTARAQYLVIHGICIVGAKQLAGRQRQDKLGAVVVDGDELRQCTDVVLQRAVKWLARNALRNEPGQYQADGPKQ